MLQLNLSRKKVKAIYMVHVAKQCRRVIWGEQSLSGRKTAQKT